MMWEQAEVELCEKLWNEGYSAAKIGEQLGRSRNSIIRKVQTLCLPVREWTGDHVLRGVRTRGLTGAPKKRYEPNPDKPRLVKPKPPVALPYEPDVMGEPNDFPKRGCLWIPGPVGLGFRCCGHERRLNSPYCDHHHAKAVAPSREHRA